MTKLHSVLIVGSSSPADIWMLADAAKLAWAISGGEKPGKRIFLAPIPFHQYEGYSSERGCILGFDGIPRLLVPYPENIDIITNSSRLKSTFLQHVETLAKSLGTGDVLFIAFSSHGRFGDGAILVGHPAETSEQCHITIREVEAALKHKPKSARVVVWVSACFSGHWLQSSEWDTFAASGKNEETYSIPTSTSGVARGSRHLLASFTTLGQKAGVEYPHPINGSASYFSSDNPPLPITTPNIPLHLLASETTETMKMYPAGEVIPQRSQASLTSRPLPFPTFTPSLLDRLKLVYPDPSRGATTDHILHHTGSDRLHTLKSAFLSAVSTNRYLSTATVNIVSMMIRFPKLAKSDTLVIHAITCHEHLLFLAEALVLTNVWEAGHQVEADILNGMDTISYYKLRRGGESSMEELFLALEVEDRFKDAMFGWYSTVSQAFITTWCDCGCLEFQIEELVSARTQVSEWVQLVGKAKPELLCSCGTHLLLTKEEYRDMLQAYKEKELLLEGEVGDSKGHTVLTSCASLADVSTFIGTNSLMTSPGIVSSKTWP
ncbi:hypothetical protein GYMLUDRAFT_43823 [Collybiopsis luxurians FD-317 M1]|uniref:Uncharacterized protein n=1 Tax=Collybiopsis luxurians FD-317 M1 TaxID=944289 RepID=A0A0D0CWM3_9AGAR|nr:hypothetical protein GYMLUDRAFT_43823 [Collybiopsis luxurians FD-317 M1]